MLKKKRDFAWNFHLPEAEFEKGVFQIQTLVSGVNFSNNMSVSQARVNMSKIEHDTAFKTS